MATNFNHKELEENLMVQQIAPTEGKVFVQLSIFKVEFYDH